MLATDAVHERQERAAQSSHANVQLLSQVAKPEEAAEPEGVSKAAIAGGVSLAAVCGLAAFLVAAKRPVKSTEEALLE